MHMKTENSKTEIEIEAKNKKGKKKLFRPLADSDRYV